MDTFDFDPHAPARGTGRVTPGERVQWLRQPNPDHPFATSIKPGRRVEILDTSGDYVLARAGNLAGWLPRRRVALDQETPTPGSHEPLIRSYRGRTPEDAARLFQADAAALAPLGYYPTSQSWAPGSYGCGAFLVALLLCVVLVGILAFIYMLLVKPEGTLTVTYAYRAPDKVVAEQEEGLMGSAQATSPRSRPTKRCSRCAEDVLADARVCRYCGHAFSESEPAAPRGPPAPCVQ